MVLISTGIELRFLLPLLLLCHTFDHTKKMLSLGYFSSQDPKILHGSRLGMSEMSGASGKVRIQECWECWETDRHQLSFLYFLNHKLELIWMMGISGMVGTWGMLSLKTWGILGQTSSSYLFGTTTSSWFELWWEFQE